MLQAIVVTALGSAIAFAIGASSAIAEKANAVVGQVECPPCLVDWGASPNGAIVGAWGIGVFTRNSSTPGSCNGSPPNCIPHTNCLLNYRLQYLVFPGFALSFTVWFQLGSAESPPSGPHAAPGAYDVAVTNQAFACGQRLTHDFKFTQDLGGGQTVTGAAFRVDTGCTNCQ